MLHVSSDHPSTSLVRSAATDFDDGLEVIPQCTWHGGLHTHSSTVLVLARRHATTVHEQGPS